MPLTIFGLSEGAFRFSLFATIFLVMAILETLLPRRPRRFKRHKRWVANFGVLIANYVVTFAVTYVMAFILPVTVIITAMAAEANGWGLFGRVAWPAWLEWTLAFILLDFVIWAQHLVTHKVPLLWRLHRVHHSDEDFDTTTAVRFHPLEILFSILVKISAVLLLGPPAVLVVIFEATVNGSALFNHANLRLPLPLDRALRWIIVTPDMHRVHHSVIHRETDSNYGFALSIWDRLFHTYNDQPEKGHDAMTIGLSEWQDERPTRLDWTLMLPFRNPAPSVPPDAPPNKN